MMNRPSELLGFGADLIGGSKYLWLQQHWTHHAFTNDVSKDPDASVRLLQRHGKDAQAHEGCSLAEH
jgi:fatty-acid desaturase